MEKDKLRSYCQFCLSEQKKGDLVVEISSEIEEFFFQFCQVKLDTTRYNQYLCCDPCNQELNAVINYRDTLKKNQQILEELFHSEEYLEEIKPEVVNGTVQEQEHVVTEYPDQVQCESCHELISSDALENHDCPQVKPGENDALGETSKLDQNHLSSKSTTKKKYPKKRLSEPISCPKCHRLFFYKAYFQFHFKDVHEIDHQKVCQFCGKIFKNSRRLNSHVLIHQTESEKKYKCDQCDKKFLSSGDLTRHKRVHASIKPYKCHMCPKAFTQSYALKLHLDVHNKIKFSCDNCQSQFSAKRTLKSHIEKCINGIAVIRSVSRNPKGENGSNRDKYKCVAEGCDRQFTLRHYLGMHLENAHGIKIENFETTCLECNLQFENVGDYAVHFKTHSCSFVCDLCKLRFKTDEKLRSHKERFHKEGEFRPFACPEPECGATFKRSEHLKGHQLYRHSNERKFECNHCDLKFRQRGEFNVHMRIHMNVKPFSCWQCSHHCKTSSNLRQHMSLVHNETSIYICNICHRTFKYSTDLTQHKKEHSPGTVYEVVETS